MIISKTREGAKVPSREADYLQFNSGNKLPVIGGKKSIGAVNIDQTRKGVFYSNIQSAIDDLYTMSAQTPINGVISLTVDSPPIAVQQVESITFSGLVEVPDSSQTSAVVHVYGFPFIFPESTNASTVCETVYNKFQDMVANEEVFDFVSRKGVNGEILEVRFIDCISHDATNQTENGITTLGTIDVPAVYGYGSWVKLGEADLPVTPAVPIYYYKRIA